MNIDSSTHVIGQNDSLEQLLKNPDHFEIEGRDFNCNDGLQGITAKGDGKTSFFLGKSYRALSRTHVQQEKYRAGIENIRVLVNEKYDQNAVERFDNHFAYRRWAGKPLTIRAFKVFIRKENELRQGSENISTISTQVKNLEELKARLPTEKEKSDYRIIGGSKVPSADKTDYAFPFLPIERSWFEFSTNAEDKKKGRESGIEESKKAILGLIEKPITKQHVEHLFSATFAAKIKSKEPLTVKELSSFIDNAIKIRTNEERIFGGLYAAVTTVGNNVQDIGDAAYNFFKDTYHNVGIAAGAAVVLEQERQTNDPIMGLAKGLAAGTLVAAETDTQRILTALAQHYIATPAAEVSSPSITSRVIKFFTFGLY